MVRAIAHLKELTAANDYGFGTVFRLRWWKARVQGRGELGVILAVDDGDEFGRTIVCTFESTPNSSYRLAEKDIEVIRK